MIQRNFVVFTASVFLFLTVFSASSLIASQENSNKPPFKSSSSQSEISNPPSVKSNPSSPQSATQNLSSISIGDPKYEKSEVIQKTKKLQMPFIANNGQADGRVAFYANTFGGTVFVTKNGEIVYALPNNSSDVETQCLASLMHSSKGIRDEDGMLHDYHVSDIMHPASWIMGRGSKSDFQNHTKSTSSDSQNLKSSNSKSAIQNLKSEISGIALREEFVGAKIKTIKGEEKSVTNVNYFKGKDPSKWKTNISTYDIVSLGEVYEGIELKLKAYGSNVEKLFCVKAGASPDQIKIKLSGIQSSGNPPPLSPSVRGTGGCPPLAGAGGGLGARGLWVNEHGELEVETELGSIKFTKPVAYQEIDGKRVEVDVEYSIQKPEFGSQRLGARSQKQETRGKRQISSREKGMGRMGAYLTSNSQLSTGNLQPETQNPSPDTRHSSHSVYSFKVASYDKTKDLTIDPLLASTLLGASGNSSGGDYGKSIVINPDGNIYVTGYTSSSDFPTTTGAYDTFYNNSTDIFISQLSSDLTSLLASTYLGGADSDYAESITVDSSGNVYVSGYTYSSGFPTTTGVYDTSYNDSGDAFVSKLSGDLTTLLASTFLGGSGTDYSNSMAIDSSGNVYVAGYTESSGFPTTQDAYDTHCCDYSSYTGEWGSVDYVFGNTFVSKLNGSLTSLLASTYLGGSDYDYGNSISVDTSGNVYVVGYTSSSDFPTTEGAYSTSSGYHEIRCDDFVGCDINYGNYDVFISKLNGELTTLLSSTCLGGGIFFGFSENPSDYNTIAIDSIGNIYVAGYTNSSDFPTTTGAYDTSYNGSEDAFVSKLSGDLTTLLASTFLGGANSDYVSSISIDANGDVYVTGYTYSSDFPTTTGAYSISYNDSTDVFVSKLNGDLTSLLVSTYLGGANSDYGSSVAIDTSGNVYVAGYTYSSDFPAIQGAYDTSYNDASDIFVSKLDDNLTNLISSTYLGGTEFYNDDYGSSITVDSDKNIYIVGYSNSSNFPMDTKTYDTSYNGSEDIFVSKLNADMTSLITSTYLGGSGNDYGSSIAINEVGNIYVTGNTYSSDFPTTTGAYDTSYSSSADIFVSELNDDLTSILASTILGGSGYDYGNSLSVGSSGNVYVSGTTYSSDFPTTTEAYDTSYNNSGDVFISKLSGNLTELLASTFLGGSEYDAGIMAIDSSGNIYTAGSTRSVDFPVTLGAYDISFNTDIYNYGYVSDAFVSKLNGDLTKLLASTFLGGYEYDYGYSVSTDSTGNVYVAGYTSSPNFPISPVALHAYYGDSTDAYISKFDSNLTSLMSSTYLESGVNDCISTDSDGNVYVAGSSSILKINDSLTSLLASASLDGNINSIALDSDGNIYVAGSTDSTEFQTTTGAYDTYNAGDYDAFVSKFDSNLSSTSPTVTTGAATDIKSTSATLKGSVNANGASTDVWFEYDTTSGSYTNITSKQSLGGLNGTDTVSTDISGLSPETKYYYRLAAQNSVGTAYGNEMSFTTLSLSKGNISGYVSDIKGNPLKSVKLILDGKKTSISITTFSDLNGFFAFYDLDADTYVIKASKKGYKKFKKKIILEAEEEEEIKVKMKKTSKRVR